MLLISPIRTYSPMTEGTARAVGAMLAKLPELQAEGLLARFASDVDVDIESMRSFDAEEALWIVREWGTHLLLGAPELNTHASDLKVFVEIASGLRYPDDKRRTFHVNRGEIREITAKQAADIGARMIRDGARAAA